MAQVLCPCLVGRELELARLRALLERAGSGSGGLVGVVGEQGVGKSGLLRQVVDEARRVRMSVLTGRGVASGCTTGFRPLSEALFGHFREHPLPEDPLLTPFQSVFGRLVPSSGGAVRPVELSPLIVGEALLRLLSLVGSDRGCLLVLDDLHLADADTLGVVEYLADHLPKTGVACVVALRPGESNSADSMMYALDARRAVGRIELSRLSTEEVRTMARACLDVADLGPEVEQLLDTRADGLPFLIEELLTAVASDAPGGRAVPASVQDLVIRRVAALGSSAPQLFAAAAVIGMRFEVALAAETAELPLTEVAELVRAAAAQHLLVAEGSEQDAVRFRHALTREAVLARLLVPERRALAARALALLNGRGPAPPGAVEVAADLAEMAGDPLQAARHLLDAGRQATAGAALGSARAALERARTLVRAPQLDPGLVANIEVGLVTVLAQAGETDRCLELGRALLASTVLSEGCRVDVNLELARAAIGGSRWSAAEEHLARARAAAGNDLGPAGRARIEALAARVAAEVGQFEEAQRRARAALEDAAGRAPDAACEALHVLGRQARGWDLDEARNLFAKAGEVASGAGLAVERIGSLFELGTVDLLGLGPIDRLREALALAEEHGALGTVVAAHLQLAWWWEDRGASEEMLAAARQARDLGASLGMHLPAAMAATAEAAALALTGDADGVERALQAAYDMAGDHPDVVAAGRGHARTMLALVADDRATALAELDGAVQVLRDARRRTPMPMWGLRALLAAVAGDDVERAVEEAEAVQVHALVASYLGLARAVLAGRAGHRADAARLFAAADAPLDGLGWLHGLARRHVAEAAIADGWGSPTSWLVESLPWVDRPATRRVADAARALIRSCGQRAPRSARPPSLPEPLASLGLSPREAEVLSLLATGASTKEIAASLYVSPKTVERHVENLVAKTATGSRRRLVVFATTHCAASHPVANGDFPDAGSRPFR